MDQIFGMRVFGYCDETRLTIALFAQVALMVSVESCTAVEA